MEKSLCLLFLFQTAACVDLKDYCRVSEKNTPCKHCTLSDRCGNFEPGYYPLTNEEKQLVLDLHNKMREEVAAGKYVDNHLRQAADMQVMSWDKETEFITECHIKQCDYKHDEKRINLEGKTLGQNIYMWKSSAFIVQRKFHLAKAVQLWTEEWKFFTGTNSDHIYTKYQKIKADGHTGHLTQAVWGRTKYLGCCYKHFKDEDFYKYLVFCDYFPSGNVKQWPIYTVGKPNCTVFNDKYPHLCGTIRPLSEDKLEIEGIDRNDNTTHKSGDAVSIYQTFTLGLALTAVLFVIISA